MNLWQERLAEGEATELRLCQAFLTHGWTVATGPKTAAYDLSIHTGERVHLVEVKDETRHAQTGNLCIELRQGRDSRPSGLSTSESTVCVHVLGPEVVVFRTQRLRLLLKQLRLPVIAFRGSDNYTSGVLLPVERLLQESWAERLPLDRVALSRVWAL